MEFKYKRTYSIYSDTYEHAVYLVCGGGPHFSRNLMQSYIQTCTIRCVVGAPILVGTSCNHTFEHALFGVWWGPHFSGNLMQSYIHTCTIRCLVEAPILVETLCNHTFKHALLGVWWGPPFLWKHHAIIHSNMHYLVFGGGPHFSGNFMKFYNIIHF